MQNKFRASYTVLSTWASGNWQRAIEQYFHLQDFVTPEMADGRKHHEDWANFIKNNKKMPSEFGIKEFSDPIVEQKMIVKINDWLDLSFIIDCYDEPVIYDWKTGKQSSESYASSMQMGVYGVGATLAGMLAKRGEIHHYDQHLKKHDMSVVFLTDKLLSDSFNWIITLGGEMQNYLLTNGLYERFGNKK